MEAGSFPALVIVTSPVQWMAQSRSSVCICWINECFNESMQICSLWEAGGEWERRKMDPAIRELLVQRRRQVVNVKIHLRDQGN